MRQHMSDVHRVDDIVVLGRSAPEPIDDGRHTICLGGYSDTLGYVRLYPTQRRMTELQRWNVVSAPIKKSQEDSRAESYKIAGSKKDWDTLHRKISKEGRLDKQEQIELTTKLSGDCTERLKQTTDGNSLGIVNPDILDASLDEQEGDTTVQMDLNNNPRKGKGNYPHKLYVEYRCDDCDVETQHRQHCIEWGLYQYWESNDDREGVKDAFGFNDATTHMWFLVGNLSHKRHAYVIISILRFQESDLHDAGVAPSGQTEFGDWN